MKVLPQTPIVSAATVGTGAGRKKKVGSPEGVESIIERSIDQSVPPSGSRKRICDRPRLKPRPLDKLGIMDSDEEGAVVSVLPIKTYLE